MKASWFYARSYQGFKEKIPLLSTAVTESKANCIITETKGHERLLSHIAFNKGSQKNPHNVLQTISDTLGELYFVL